jgi:predicted transcriptional regulator
MGKTRRIILVAGAIMAMGICAPTISSGDQPQLAQVVYITLTKACGCLLSVCQAGDIVVGNVFNGARQSLLKRIDYSTDKETAKVYIKKYRVTQAPALLFLDAGGNLLWMKAGDLNEQEIADKLSQLGG